MNIYVEKTLGKFNAFWVCDLSKKRKVIGLGDSRESAINDLVEKTYDTIFDDGRIEERAMEMSDA